MISTFPVLEVDDISILFLKLNPKHNILCIKLSQTYIELNVTLKISPKCNWRCIRASWGWARPNLVGLFNCWNCLYILFFFGSFSWMPEGHISGFLTLADYIFLHLQISISMCWKMDGPIFVCFKEFGVENEPKGKLYSIDTICKTIAFYSCSNTASS